MTTMKKLVSALFFCCMSWSVDEMFVAWPSMQNGDVRVVVVVVRRSRRQRYCKHILAVELVLDARRVQNVFVDAVNVFVEII